MINFKNIGEGKTNVDYYEQHCSDVIPTLVPTYIHVVSMKYLLNSYHLSTLFRIMPILNEQLTNQSIFKLSAEIYEEKLNNIHCIKI